MNLFLIKNYLPKISNFTFVTPLLIFSISLNAALLKSITLPLIKGPLSLILTITDLPLLTFVTLTFVPKGKLL